MSLISSTPAIFITLVGRDRLSSILRCIFGYPPKKNSVDDGVDNIGGTCVDNRDAGEDCCGCNGEDADPTEEIINDREKG